MLALTFAGNSRIEMKNLPIPVPKAGEVLVEVGASAICGSEMRPFRSTEGLPYVPGHEIVGTVVDNPGTEGPKIGDRIAVNVISGCGQCRYCRTHDRRFCAQQGFINGGHAEFVAVPAYTCLPLPDSLPFDVGVLLGGDTIGVAFHALAKVPVAPRDSVLLVGAGPVGLGFIALLGYLGVHTLVAEISQYRQQLAKKLGAEHVIDPTTVDAADAVRDLTLGRGADVAIDASGTDGGVNLALNAVRKEGKVIFAGAGHQASINPWAQFLAKEIIAYGVWYFTDADYYGILDAYAHGLRVDGLLTHRFPLAKAAEAYDLFSRGETGKVILLPHPRLRSTSPA